MKLSFQGINNGNGKLTLTADNLKFACQELGIPDDAHTLRRAARAFDLYHSGKVEHVNNHTFKVASQYDLKRPYRVQIKQTPYLKAGCVGESGCTTAFIAYCTCQDWMNYSGDQDLPDVNFWCKHSIAALVWLHNNNGWVRCKRAMRSTTPSTDTTPSTGNSRQSRDSQMQLDITDPFQEAEALDIAQIEGRSNGELAWKLRSGEYVISYAGVMKLAAKHEISFDEISVNDNTVIAKAKNGNERVSGKPIYDNANANTAIELAKRNAARQLLPLPEILAVEKKAQLEAEFDWKKAKSACLKLVPEYNLSILISDLVNAGKLRQDNPSHYDRTEWLLIHDYCKKDAIAQKEMDPEGKSLNRWSYNSVVFLEECYKRIDAMRAEKQVEANELPPMKTDGKRKLQMDKKLRTWLVEADGTKKEISCREICEQFENKANPSIVTRLRAGIDSGADISTVELN